MINSFTYFFGRLLINKWFHGCYLAVCFWIGIAYPGELSMKFMLESFFAGAALLFVLVIVGYRLMIASERYTHKRYGPGLW